jgi:hypothetical protein
MLASRIAHLSVLASAARLWFNLPMSDCCQSISPELAAWIARQPVFFVATAPLATNGHVNASPKGGDSFRILGPGEIAYQDYTGSGAETAAHLRENGRIVVMFCAFDDPPRIVRLHGRGTVVEPGHAKFTDLARHFPAHPARRSFIQVTVTRISTSCGHGVPLMEFRGPRDRIERWAASKGPAGLAEYRASKNRHSIDGLPAFDHNEGPSSI